MIVERLMKPGTWDLTLIPETPKIVRDALVPFGHIVIHEAHVDNRVMSDVDLTVPTASNGGALYVGVLRRRATPFSMSGAGMALWLGDEEGKGPLITLNIGGGTFGTWGTQILVAAGASGAVQLGAVTAVSGAATNTFTNVTQRSVLDWICAYFTGLGGGAAEYRVSNDAKLYAGLSSVLFNTTPTTIVMPREGGREVAGLVGIAPDVFSVELDADSYSTAVLLTGGAGTGTANLAPATPYKNFLGGAVVLTRQVSSPQTAAGQEATVAAAYLGLYPLRQIVKLTSARYDLPHDVRAGDWLYVYDPERDLIDLTNPQQYRGQIVNPIKLRVFALAWPVEAGMGVYYRPGTGNGIGGAPLGSDYVDLTPYVQFEPSGTEFELGAQVRGLTVP